MNKIISAFLLVFALSSQGIASDVPFSMKGVLIDNLCLASHKADIATYITRHTKDCALLPSCAAKGYSIYSKGKISFFDDASNIKIEKFLRRDGTTLNVSIIATNNGNKLALRAIKNGTI